MYDPKYVNLMHSDLSSLPLDKEAYSNRTSSFSGMGASFYDDPLRFSTEGSPMMMSPWNQVSPFANAKTPWPHSSPAVDEAPPQNALIGSLVREEGHIYSLVTRGDLLYTGSDSKNIRVWKNMKEFSWFKSASGLVKAIVISGERIFTGHQDGKIRVWKVSPKNPSIHKKSGSLPTLKDIFKCSIKPSNYVDKTEQLRGGEEAPECVMDKALRCHILPQLDRGSSDPVFGILGQDFQGLEDFGFKVSRVRACA